MALASSSFLDEHHKQLAAASAAAAPAAGKQAKPVKALQVADIARARERKREAEREEKRKQLRLAVEARKAVTAMAAKHTCTGVPAAAAALCYLCVLSHEASVSLASSLTIPRSGLTHPCERPVDPSEKLLAPPDLGLGHMAR
jgi:hypothetical protein